MPNPGTRTKIEGNRPISQNPDSDSGFGRIIASADAMERPAFVPLSACESFQQQFSSAADSSLDDFRLPARLQMKARGRTRDDLARAVDAMVLPEQTTEAMWVYLVRLQYFLR